MDSLSTGSMRTTIPIISETLGERREAHLIQLGDFTAGNKRIALFCTDGQSIKTFCSQLMSAPPKIPVLIVGVASNPSTRDYDYIRGYDSTRYAAHKSFWFDEMMHEINAKYDISDDQCVIGMVGYSNGATFAHTTVVEYPSIFDFGILFSAADNRIRIEEYDNNTPLKFYLAAGTREPEYLQTTKRIADELESMGIENTFVQRATSHDISFWSAELPTAMEWIIESYTEESINNRKSH